MMRGARELVLASLMTAGATAAWATNGMDIEGYGPIAFGMGGGSFAYDNGTAGMANNPATLSLLADGVTRLDIALGFLGPDISSSVQGMDSADSSAHAFYMPALGLVFKRGAWAYGFGVFGQGGMGADYADTSFLALNSGDEVRSELSVGRAIVPVSYQVTDKLSMGGTLDFIWGGMDVKMALTAPQGMGLISGMPTLALPPLGATDYMRVDFSDDSQFTGSAKGYGVDAKFGALYAINPGLRIGAVYHAEPELGDLESSDASLSFGSMITGEQGGLINGKVDVHDFRWPAMAGAGVAYDVTESLMLVADVRYIFWSDTMDSLNITFTADGGAGSVTMELPQNWEDQTVYMVGLQYKATEDLALRAGYNYGNNPVPAETVNPLFPAIVEQHIALGAGYVYKDAHLFDIGISIVPEKSVDSPSGVTVSHSQLNAQVMYSLLF